MNEVDKIIQRMSNVTGWMRSGKENENIRHELYSAAAKTCRELADIIEALENTDE